jgi:hypothetical protein
MVWVYSCESTNCGGSRSRCWSGQQGIQGSHRRRCLSLGTMIATNVSSSEMLLFSLCPTSASTTPGLGGSIKSLGMWFAFLGWSLGPRGSLVAWAVLGHMSKLVAPVTTDPQLFSSTCSVTNFGSKLVESSMKPRQIIISFLRRCLRSPETLSLEALVLCLQGSDYSIPTHGLGVIVHFVMDLDRLQLEGQYIAVQESGCSKNN